MAVIAFTCARQHPMTSEQQLDLPSALSTAATLWATRRDTTVPSQCVRLRCPSPPLLSLTGCAGEASIQPVWSRAAAQRRNRSRTSAPFPRLPSLPPHLAPLWLVPFFLPRSPSFCLLRFFRSLLSSGRSLAFGIRRQCATCNTRLSLILEHWFACVVLGLTQHVQVNTASLAPSPQPYRRLNLYLT